MLFVGSSLTVVGLAYWLLATSLEQRDRDIIETTLVRYAGAYRRGGLDGLNRAIVSDRSAGAYEPLFVRVLGAREDAVFLSKPEDWSIFDLSQLSHATSGVNPWTELRAPGSEATLEIASARGTNGTLFQVGKSTERRLELLGRFRRVLLVVSLSILLIALTGGVLLTRSALRPLRELIATVTDILETGSLEARVAVRRPDDPLGELGTLFNALLDRIQSLITAMRGSLDNVAHDCALR